MTPLGPIRAVEDRVERTGAFEVIGRIGSAAWATIALVVVLALALAALSAVSEIVLPFVLAAVLAVVFTPLCNVLSEHRLPRGLSSLIVVTIVVAVVVGTCALAAVAIADQLDTWTNHVDSALDEATPAADDAGLDRTDLQELRESIAGLAALVTAGALTRLVGGVESIFGFLAGAVLGLLILYYLLKDGDALRERVLRWWPSDVQDDADAFVTRAVATIRTYAAGRTTLSAAVALITTVWSALLGLPMLGTIAVVNFVGGYVPYVGGFIGGAVVVILTLSEHGVRVAVASLVVVLVANFGLENLLEPRVLGERFRTHPLVVLIVTTFGGIVGGIIGLILAVPVFLVGADAVVTVWRRMRHSGRSRASGAEVLADETPSPDEGDAVPAAWPDA